MKFSAGFLCFLFLFLITCISCKQVPARLLPSKSTPFYPSSKPCVRWWWFATEIKRADIKYQLDWVRKMNFGGVEIAWVYPLYRYQKMYADKYNRHYPKDTTAQKWLSPEWSAIVAFTKSYADSIGLSCDFTFGSAWPVAATNIDRAHSTQIYGDSAFQQLLTFSWEYPDTQFVINHLDSNAFNLFAEPVGNALKESLQGSKSALFTDSWEIKLNTKNKIWTQGFEEAFNRKFDYDIIPFMTTGLDSFPDVRYDYMMLLDELVTNGFYKPFVNKCRDLNAWSRVQCLGSPTDVMTTYSLVDIPESEAMLNNPNYSRIVSSSATLASKYLVSCEAFTCMYGFPATYLRLEQTADLKMVADALFAQGINHFVYHGMPYNPAGSDTTDFFATTYFGPGGSLTPELADFNKYIEKVSELLSTGKTYSDVAVYIPYEDAVMKGAYPPERQRVWVWGEYEMRYIYPPKETEGYQPLWINRHFLEQADFVNNKLVVGDAAFSSLYLDVEYLDVKALSRILFLAKKGLPICLKQLPQEPGKIKTENFKVMMNELANLKNVSGHFNEIVNHPPLIQCDSIPAYWCKLDRNGNYYLFIAQPLAQHIEYPIYSGQSWMKESVFKEISIHLNGKSIKRNFEFKPYQSLFFKISPDGNLQSINITFVPHDPVVRPKEVQKTYF